MTSAAPRVGRLFHAKRARRPLAGVAAVALFAATACGGDSSTAPHQPLAGVYSLEKVARIAVPVEVYEGPFYHAADQRSYDDFVVVMTGGSLELTADDRYRTTLNYRAIKDGVEEIGSLQTQGVYTVSNDEIFFERDNGVDFGMGRVERGAIVLSLDVVGKGAPKPYTFAR